MYEWVRPSIAVPAHGEAQHLEAHAQLARDLGVRNVVSLRNGQMVRLAPGFAEVIDEVPVGRIYKDGFLVGTQDEMGIGERRKLSYAGHVSVVVQLNARLELRGDPELSMIGLPKEDFEGEDMEEALVDAAAGAVESIPKARRKDFALVREAVRRAIRGEANDAWGKKPLVTVFVIGG